MKHLKLTDEEKKERKRIAQNKYYQKNKQALFEKAKKWAKNNRDSVNNTKKKYYAKNPKRVIEYVNKYKLQNPDKVKQFAKNYRQANKQKLNLRAKKWKEENPERNKLLIKNWCVLNNDKVKQRSKKDVDALKNHYVINLIAINTKIDKEIIKQYPELIETQKIILQTKRLCKI